MMIRDEIGICFYFILFYFETIVKRQTFKLLYFETILQVCVLKPIDKEE